MRRSRAPIVTDQQRLLRAGFAEEPIRAPLHLGGAELPCVHAVAAHLLAEAALAGNPDVAGEAGGELEIIYARSEEHTSELQSRFVLVCRLLLDKKNSSL